MLDNMSGGRLDIGFGKGASPIEMEYFGLTPATAQSMYDEGIEFIRKALAGGELTFEGQHFRAQNVPIEMTPFGRRPPMWYGAHSVESAQRAARNRRNIINNDSTTGSIAAIQGYRLALQDTPADDKEPLAGLARFIVVAESDQLAMDIANRAYARWHASFTHLYRRRGMNPMRGERSSTYTDLCNVEEKGVAGSPETVTRWLENQLTQTGANYLVGQFAFGDLTLEETTKSVTLFREQVMPRLAERFSDAEVRKSEPVVSLTAA